VRARRGLAAIALLLPLACTTKSSNNPYLPPGGTGGTGGLPPTGELMVRIDTPANDAVVSDSTDLNVSATVTVTDDLIDTSSVKVVVTAMGSPAVISSGQLVSTGGESFSGTISLGALPTTGSYTLTVSAKSLTGLTAHDAVTFTVQGGPTLIVNAPAEGQAYNDSLSIQILVDHGANAPTAVLAGNNVTLSSPPATSGAYDVYTATVWFGPPPTPAGSQTFQQLSGKQLLDVKESDGTATTEVFRTFVIDTSGPTITKTTPVPGQIVGGVLNISATVTDEAGLLDSSVVAVVGDQQGNPLFRLQLIPQGSGVYSVLFDTLNLTRCGPPPSTLPCIVFPTISFRASDSVGNETSLGYDFSVDNMPPLADLDPPQMRQMQLASFGYECSYLFDPRSVNRDLGDMPNDGCMVPQIFDLRARIEDQGNDASGLKVTPIAGIDPDNTSVYILTDNTQPLVVDTNGDGYCDSINPQLAPTTGPLTQADQVLKIRLGGVPPAGAADFEGPPTPGAAADPGLPIPGRCVQGKDPAPPKVLCKLDGFEQPTIAIGYLDNQPAIWSVEPIDAGRCMGNQLDTRANNIPEGQWICMAVATADLAGNQSVSRPMRVFVNYSDGGGFCATPPAGSPAPPPCTGSYDPVAKTAALGGCQTLKFTGTELYCAPGGC
jgi:hypothetical protein